MGRQQLPFVLKSLVERLKKYAAAEDGENAQENRKSRWSSGTAPRITGCGGSLEQGVERRECEESRSEAKQVWRMETLSGVTMWCGNLSIWAVLGLSSAWKHFCFSKRLTQRFGDRAGTLFRHSSRGETGKGIALHNECHRRGFLFWFWLLIRWLLRQ